MNKPPANPAVHANIARWHQHLRNYVGPSAKAPPRLGNLYNRDPQFNASNQEFDARLAQLMRSAIAVYCQWLGPGA